MLLIVLITEFSAELATSRMDEVSPSELLTAPRTPLSEVICVEIDQ